MPDFSPAITYVKNTFVVSDLLQAAYRKARALKHPGQGISGSESKEGLDLLNAMLDGMKIEGLMVIYFRRSLQTVNASQKIYGVGPGQDFDIERPEKIATASYLIGTDPNTSEIPMESILTFERFQALTVKSVSSTVPLAFYYQPSAPYGTLQFWPVPSIASQIAIYTAQTLSEFSTVDDAVDMPNGYREMLEYNLAVAVHELYPDRPMDPGIERRASLYKSRVKNNQLMPIFIGSDPAVMQEGRRGETGGNPRAWTPY